MATKTPTSYNYQGYNVDANWGIARVPDGGGHTQNVFFNPTDPSQHFSVAGDPGILQEVVTQNNTKNNSNIYHLGNGSLTAGNEVGNKTFDFSKVLNVTDNGGNHFAYSTINQNNNIEKGSSQGNNLNINNFQAQMGALNTQSGTVPNNQIDPRGLGHDANIITDSPEGLGRPSINIPNGPTGIMTPNNPPPATPPVAGQIGAIPNTNNGVGNSTTGNQYTSGQVAAGFGNVSNSLIPQEQQRQAMKVDPNNITGYQDISKV